MAWKRIICPNKNHKENTPSCVIYPTMAYCFGCRTKFDLKDLNIDPETIEYEETIPDLVADLTRINNLPKMAVRGLTLPCDGDYFYIVYPGCNYFIARSLTLHSGRKYLCPSGARRPIYRARIEGNETLAIVEGELDAASLALVPGTFDVCSPGAASNFNIERDLKFYLTYKRFYLYTDKDRAGFDAAVTMKTQLLKYTPFVTVVFKNPERDFNDILQEEGANGVAKWLRENGGASMGVQDEPHVHI